MNKISKIFFIFLLILINHFAYAQIINSVEEEEERTSFFQKTYIRLQSGLYMPLTEGISEITYLQGFEMGKNITPSFGIAVERWVKFSNVYGETAINFSNTTLNLKFNLSNIFAGYKGEPRCVDVKIIPGIGWGKKYTNNPDLINNNKNTITYNIFSEIDFNLGKKKRCQINFNSGIIWYTGDGNVDFNIYRSGIVCKLGFSYKFGRKNTYNFKKRNYVSREKYDNLLKKYIYYKNLYQKTHPK